MKKRMLALACAAAMVLSLAACGGKKEETQAADTQAATEAQAEETTEAVKTNSGSADGKYELALVTDLGTIDDKACLLYTSDAADE